MSDALTHPVELTPVDVEFESSFRELSEVSSSLKASPHEVPLQKRFCQLLRECKIALEKVVDTYGSRYRGGRGADLLVREAKDAIHVLEQANVGNIRLSIARHYDRIASLQNTFYIIVSAGDTT